MPYGNIAGHGLQIRLTKYIGHQPHAPAFKHARAIFLIFGLLARYNARALLAPVLLGIKTKIRHTGGLGVIVNAYQAHSNYSTLHAVFCVC